MTDPPSPDPRQGCPQTVVKLWTFRILVQKQNHKKHHADPAVSYTRVCTRPRLFEAFLCWKVETPVALSAPHSSRPRTAASPASLASCRFSRVPCLSAWATCPAPQPAHTFFAFQSTWEEAPLSGHEPQPVWVLDPGASPPGLHTHQGDPGICAGRGSWQMLTVGF